MAASSRVISCSKASATRPHGKGLTMPSNVRDRLNALFVNFGELRNPTEAETEKELIWPLLEALDWTEMLIQQNLSAKRRDDVPDALLFPNAETKQKAMPLSAWQRFQHGACVVEAKRWARPLDRADAGQRDEEGVPSTQMLRLPAPR